jgi:hypothetical protein
MRIAENLSTYQSPALLGDEEEEVQDSESPPRNR